MSTLFSKYAFCQTMKYDCLVVVLCWLEIYQFTSNTINSGLFSDHQIKSRIKLCICILYGTQFILQNCIICGKNCLYYLIWQFPLFPNNTNRENVNSTIIFIIVYTYTHNWILMFELKMRLTFKKRRSSHIQVL